MKAIENLEAEIIRLQNLLKAVKFLAEKDRVPVAKELNNMIRDRKDRIDWIKAKTEDKYLKQDELELGEIYKIRARNFDIGRYTEKGFEGIRVKFRYTFMDEEDHWDTGPPHGTVKPLRKATQEEAEQWLEEVAKVERTNGND